MRDLIILSSAFDNDLFKKKYCRIKSFTVHLFSTNYRELNTAVCPKIVITWFFFVKYQTLQILAKTCLVCVSAWSTQTLISYLQNIWQRHKLASSAHKCSSAGKTPTPYKHLVVLIKSNEYYSTMFSSMRSQTLEH